MFFNRDFFVGDARHPMQTRRAFSLIEVTFAMAILALLAGTLYSLVDASIRGAAELEARQLRCQQLSGIVELLRKTFRSIPPAAAFEARIVQQRENFVPELVFRNAPGLFLWGDANQAFLSTILGVRSQIGGLSNFSILQDSEEGIGSYLGGGVPLRPWVTLMSGLQKVGWRFYDPRSQVWVKEWKEPSFRPAFAELSLTMEQEDQRFVFWLPPVQGGQK